MSFVPHRSPEGDAGDRWGTNDIATEVGGSLMFVVKKSLALMVALVLLMSLAPATASWSWRGSSEPSTDHDGESFMWRSAPTSLGSRRIYFNVVAFNEPPVGDLGLNPNAGALDTRNENFGAEQHEAMLGVWIDCNRDGYVGMMETALREYPSTALLDWALCPPSYGSKNSWNGDHNYNGWVSELVPIANAQVKPTDKRVYRDDSAMVWGDYGKPTPDPVQCGNSPGDTVLRWLDCVHQFIPEGTLPPELEDTWPRISPIPPKTSAQWNFHFLTSARGASPVNLMSGGTAGADARAGIGGGGSRWVADSILVKPLPRTVRTSDSIIEDAPWTTFYASVGGSTLARGLALPSGATGYYGTEACGTNAGGTHNGWNCDPDAWYRYAGGEPYPEDERQFARPGQAYRLRDVDCYDGMIAETGVALGLPNYGPSPCT